ncbi:hypothetical protein BGW36DRAFT_451427 [Talaromyces proteolyticus]|uniref:RTA1 domain protein n=1 Tax=Talaromyces proteolyticus TaxID=1131652 RepID=A0AAD4KP84_9EURO|nr:uncharacterized protein BGW36DRAFT_451427 [Talaromyces proteolyticus]KAH8696235.1 hypothetical protein BGW36DRAFT_451427 [Talaromyces proteolyticus]
MFLIQPSLFAASIYMILGRIIRMLNGVINSLERPSWLTKIFVTGDVLSFLIQSGCGGMLATAKTQDKLDLGQHGHYRPICANLVFCLLYRRFSHFSPRNACNPYSRDRIYGDPLDVVYEHTVCS